MSGDRPRRAVGNPPVLRRSEIRARAGRPRRNGTVRRRGYVLLVTLGLLVLSTALLVTVARAAVRHAAAARLGQQQSQRRWAVESARRAVLPFAEQILATAEQSEGRPAAAVRAGVRLGDTLVTLVVADEQAKASVNDMLTRHSRDAAEEALRRALSGSAAAAHVRLRTAPAELTRATTGDAAAVALPPVSGFGQVFDDVSDAVLRPAAGASPLDALTVWGDGGLNLLRADRTAMRVALTPTLSALDLDRLLAARDATFAAARQGRALPLPPGAAAGADAVGLLLSRADVPPGVRAKASLVGRSACHSLSVGVNDGRRVWYDTSVIDETDPRQPADVRRRVVTPA